jgi:predicted dehydrogenase
MKRRGPVSLASARAEEFCREYGFAAAYTDVEKMFADESIDACVSVMPMERIAEMGIKLLERGTPCVIEKPLGTSIEDVERLARAARETATPHMVSVNRRFMPLLNRARALARETGPLRFIRATMVRHERREPDFIWSTALHAVDALRHIGGEVVSFSTKVQKCEGLSPLWYVISLLFEGGPLGQVEVLTTAGSWEESYELFCDGFRAQVISRGLDHMSLQCWRNRELVADETMRGHENEDIINGAYDETVSFVKALRTGARLGPTIEDVLPSSRICFQIAADAGALS